jgi:AraC-like DNA-binding protein
MSESKVLHEITPLADHDFMYVADRHKKEFTYPIHCHEIFELNFVENGEGCRRTVGDSSEVIGQYDLVLITSPQLEHVWEQHHCQSTDIHEVTVQFYVDFNSEDSVWHTNPFSSIYKMFVRAKKGLAFPLGAIMQVYPMLIRLSSIKEGFYAVRELMTILYELSKQDGARELSSTAFAKVVDQSDSRRVLKVKHYIEEHYRDELRLAQLSAMVGMTDSAFSRFFKQRTGKNLNEYIVDVRLGHAARLLVDTTHTVSEICYETGFNTVCNFNRLFKKRKGCNPTEFREKYRKTKVIV